MEIAAGLGLIAVAVGGALYLNKEEATTATPKKTKTTPSPTTTSPVTTPSPTTTGTGTESSPDGFSFNNLSCSNYEDIFSKQRNNPTLNIEQEQYTNVAKNIMYIVMDTMSYMFDDLNKPMIGKEPWIILEMFKIYNLYKKPINGDEDTKGLLDMNRNEFLNKLKQINQEYKKKYEYREEDELYENYIKQIETFNLVEETKEVLVICNKILDQMKLLFLQIIDEPLETEIDDTLLFEKLRQKDYEDFAHFDEQINDSFNEIIKYNLVQMRNENTGNIVIYRNQSNTNSDKIKRISSTIFFHIIEILIYIKNVVHEQTKTKTDTFSKAIKKYVTNVLSSGSDQIKAGILFSLSMGMEEINISTTTCIQDLFYEQFNNVFNTMIAMMKRSDQDRARSDMEYRFKAIFDDMTDIAMAVDKRHLFSFEQPIDLQNIKIKLHPEIISGKIILFVHKLSGVPVTIT